MTGSFTINNNIWQLNFISGGTTELTVGNDFIGATSGVLNTARYIKLNPGSPGWGTGNAEGVIGFNAAGGGFAADENFNLVGGQDDIFTVVGGPTRPPFIEGEWLMMDGLTNIATLKLATIIGPSVTVKNNIFINSQGAHVSFNSTAKISRAYFDNNLYYPDGSDKFFLGPRGSDFAGWQAQTPFFIGSVGDPNDFRFDNNSTVANPLFENLSSSYSASSDFKLTRNSQGIDAGEDVSSDMGLTLDQVKDFDRNNIVHLTDIGALEYPYSSVPPTADAGPDQTVNEGVLVILDGSGSSDSIDGIAEWRWTPVSPITQILGSVALSGETVSGIVPDIPGPEDLIVTILLTVTDNGGLTDTDTVTITVRDVPGRPKPTTTTTTIPTQNGPLTTKEPWCFISSVF
jgi:hypothetical protein